jgi:predicted dinucleotide-binding enzyme
MQMKIGFIGTGGMTHALASKWKDKHALFFGGRDAAKADRLVQVYGGRSGTTADAVAFAHIVVLSVPSGAVFDAIKEAGGANAFAKKIVIDITNPVDLATFISTRPGNSSNTEALAAALPSAHLAKAFNMAHTSVWEAADMTFDGRRFVALFTADKEAVEPVNGLIVDTGAEPLLVGDNSHAYQLEAAAAIVIKLLFSGRAGETVLNLIQPEIKAVR